MLIFLQRLRSWQIVDRDAALNRLEESRIILIEKMKQYPAGRSIDVVKELNAWLNSGKITAFDWNWNGEINKEVDSNKGTRSGFISFCIRMLIDPCNWQKAIGVAAKLVVISASISSTMRLCHARQQQYSAQSKDTVPSVSDRPLEVFHGRG